MQGVPDVTYLPPEVEYALFIRINANLLSFDFFSYDFHHFTDDQEFCQGWSMVISDFIRSVGKQLEIDSLWGMDQWKSDRQYEMYTFPYVWVYENFLNAHGY